MNGSYRDSSERSPLDFFFFAVAAFGFFSGVAGTIVTSIPAAICGALILGIGLAYFAMRSS